MIALITLMKCVFIEILNVFFLVTFFCSVLSAERLKELDKLQNIHLLCQSCFWLSSKMYMRRIIKH